MIILLQTPQWESQIMLRYFSTYKNKTKKLRGFSPRTNYTDRRLSVKLVPTFAARGVLRSQRGGSPTAVISIS
jgi:hypothetical protein